MRSGRHAQRIYNVFGNSDTGSVENRLELFKRWPSDLRRYAKWSFETRAAYGTIPNYIMKERLYWQPLATSTAQTGPLFDVKDPVPFADSKDYRILPNDWPYGLEKSMTHIIIWLKNRLETEPVKGELTPTAQKQVEAFVQKTFIDRVKDLPGTEDTIMFFKNPTILQSVPGLEHIHVICRLPKDIVEEWTGGEKTRQG